MERIGRIANAVSSPQLERMTFPYYRSFLRRIAPDGPFFAYAAWRQSAGEAEPVALLLGTYNVGAQSAEVLSLYVNREFRGRGVGRRLLEEAEAYLTARGIKRLRGSFVAFLPARAALERTLAARGFQSPVPLTRLYRFDREGKLAEAFRLKRYEKYRSSSGLRRGYDLSPWKALSPVWQQTLAHRQNQPGWFKDWENPFRGEIPADPEYSYALWLDGEPVGWLVTHRLAPDLLRYTHVFIREDLQRTGMAMALIICSFWDNHLRGGPRRCWCGIRRDNAPFNAMVMKRFGPFAETIDETFLAEKTLGAVQCPQD